MDGGASSPATATPSEKDTISCGNRFDWKFERLRPSRAHPEAEGTDSPPHHPFSDSAEILRISGRGICKEAIFSPGGQAPPEKKSAPGATNRNLRFRLVSREATCLPFGQATFPPRRSPASIGSREGSHPLELSRGCSGGDFGFRRSGLFFCGRCFRRHGAWGALLPYTPSGDEVREGCDPLALSRGCSFDGLVSDDTGYSFEELEFRRRGRGALRSPTPPRVTGCERVATLSRSPGGCSFDGLVSDDAGYSFEEFEFRRRGTRGAPLPYSPSGTGCERVRPSRALPGVFWRRCWFPTGLGVFFWSRLRGGGEYSDEIFF